MCQGVILMQVVYVDAFNIEEPLKESCACIGYFDGFHRGHQVLLDTCIQHAKKKNLASALITFDPDPWTVFKHEKQKHLMTLDDKIQFAQSYGFDIMYIIQFSLSFSQLSIQQFHDVIHKLNVKCLVCGFDFRYGHKNSGDIHSLQEQSLFDVTVIDSVNFSNLKISTSRIEPLILNGEIEQANDLLGYIYSISGTIEHGYKRGSTLIQIPTANLKTKEEYIIPCTGVYAGYVLIDKVYLPAMINIGCNPTFNNQNLTIEAHILDFNQDIYEKHARFFFSNHIRKEIKFNSIDSLKKQLLMDIETTKILLKNDKLIKNTRKLF